MLKKSLQQLKTLSRKEKGQYFEDMALSHLTSGGCFCIKRNYRTKLGEIDLIVQDQHFIVFVEVKYRSSDNFGSAVESVDSRKIKKIQNTAQVYLQQFSTRDLQPRFDVVGITKQRHAVSGRSTFEINWIKNAF